MIHTQNHWRRLAILSVSPPQLDSISAGETNNTRTATLKMNKSTNSIQHILLATLILAASAAPVRAGMILQAVSASTDMGTLAGAIAHVRDQTGLSAAYTSGVTDFDSYIASNPTHNSSTSGNDWFSVDPPAGNVDFDLGGTYTIESFALWNMGFDWSYNVTEFDLLADDNVSFSSPVTLLSNESANPYTGSASAVKPEVFTFAPTAASFVRLVITAIKSGSSAAFGEAAFEAEPIPEPSSLVLISLAAMGFAPFMRRRKTNR